MGALTSLTGMTGIEWFPLKRQKSNLHFLTMISDWFKNPCLFLNRSEVHAKPKLIRLISASSLIGSMDVWVLCDNPE